MTTSANPNCGRCGGSGCVRAIRGDVQTSDGSTMPCPACLHRSMLRYSRGRASMDTNDDPAEHDCMAIEESLADAREDMRAMEAREPTQDEGDRAQGGPPNYRRRECFVALGGWTGRRCHKCDRWVWGGPTLCLACDRESSARESIPVLCHDHQNQMAAINDYVSRLIGAERGLCRCCGRAHAIQHDDDCPVPHLIRLTTGGE